MNRLNHPQVATSEGGGMRPVQYIGTLVDGQYFYFRYLYGYASLGFGITEEEAIEDRFQTGFQHGDAYQGSFDDDDERDEVFDRLMTLRLTAARP